MTELTFLPIPQQIVRTSGVHALGRPCLLRVRGCAPDRAQQWFDAIPELAPFVSSESVDAATAQPVVLELVVEPRAGAVAESHEIHITPDRIDIRAVDEAGLHAATMTVRQAFRQCAEAGGVPCLQVRDWPHFRHRGIMLDISRNRVPTLETLFALVEQMAEWKLNQFQLYTEHTFAYREHPDVWQDASPMTPDEIFALDRFCRERYIELVPNQNSLGHMTNWLTLPAYAHLAETSGEYETVFGHQDKPWGLCTTDPASLTFLEGLYDDLLPHFTSTQLNIGCDEAVDIGKGRSRGACRERGVGGLYLDFIRKIHGLATTRGKRIQLWADMMNQYTDLIPLLPDNVVALEWGYEEDWDFAEHLHPFRAAGVDCYVCPGTSSWNALVGRTRNARGNLQRAAEQGIAGGAEGYLIADWGDNGHWQHLSVSLPGFAIGAAAAWSVAPGEDAELARALDLHVFHDRARIIGQAVLDLGNLYLEFDVLPFNSTTFFNALYHWNDSEASETHHWANVTAETWNRVLDRTDVIRNRLRDARPEEPHVLREILNMIEFVRHACMLARARAKSGSLLPVASLPDADRHALSAHLADVQDQFQQVWKTRHKEGWLHKSLAPLRGLLDAYQGENIGTQAQACTVPSAMDN